MDAVFDWTSVRRTWKAEVNKSPLVKSTLGLAREKSSCPPPKLYVTACGSAAAASKRWQRTLEWRRAQGVDGILDEPLPDFAAIKATYPHYLHGRTADGSVVFVEALGLLDTSLLPARANVARHFAFVHEFVSRKYDGEETTLVSVLDVSGLEWNRLFSAKALELLMTAASVQEHLVPFRIRAILVANAPSWFGAAFRLLPLPKALRDKVRVADCFTGIFSNERCLPCLEDLRNHPDELALCARAQPPPRSMDDDGEFFTARSASSDDSGEVYFDARPDTDDDEETSTWWFERLFLSDAACAPS